MGTEPHEQTYRELSAPRIWKEVESAGSCLRGTGGSGGPRLHSFSWRALFCSTLVECHQPSPMQGLFCFLLQLNAA